MGNVLPHKRIANFAIFDWNRRLPRKRYMIGPWFLWNINRKSQVADQSVPDPMTLINLTRISRSRYTYKLKSQKWCVLGTKLL